MTTGSFFALAPSRILLRVRIRLVVDLPSLDPLWLSLNFFSISGCIRLRIILMRVFTTSDVSEMPQSLVVGISEVYLLWDGYSVYYLYSPLIRGHFDLSLKPDYKTPERCRQSRSTQRQIFQNLTVFG